MDLNALLAIAGIGSSVGGALLGNRAQNQSNDLNAQNAERLFGLADQERAHRDQLTNMFMPSVMGNLRMKGPAPQIGGQMSNMQGQQKSAGLVQPGTPTNNTIGKTIGGAGTGGLIGTAAGSLLGGIGGGAALGGMAGPIGAGVGALGGLAASQIGKGRRAADAWTKTTQNDFGQQVSGIIDPYNQQKAAGTLTPDAEAKAREEFNKLLAVYTASANQYGGSGGQQKKVIDQMWSQFNQPGYIPDWKKTLGIS